MRKDEDEDLIDWDFRIEDPPKRETKTVLVRFVEGKYRKPAIVEEDGV